MSPGEALHIFIASASEGLEVAKTLREELSANEEFKPRVWNESTFKPGMTFIEALESELDQSDFAVLTLTADDKIVSRGESKMAPRDNLLFELGLFMGRLGRERTYFLFDKLGGPKIPTDLMGVTAAYYEMVPGKSLAECLRPGAGLLANRMKELGAREKYSAEELVEVRQTAEFCESIAGEWWEILRSQDDIKVSLFRIIADPKLLTARLEGDSFDVSGELLAQWRSVAVGIRAAERTFLYCWEGEHPAAAPGQSYRGFGQFVFNEGKGRYQHGAGMFADVQLGKKSVVWKSAELRRVGEDEVDRIERIGRESSRRERAALIAEVLERFEGGGAAKGAAIGGRDPESS